MKNQQMIEKRTRGRKRNHKQENTFAAHLEESCRTTENEQQNFRVEIKQAKTKLADDG
jgi:hypothetical protein